MDGRQYRLSKSDRDNFAWNQTTSRRQTVPRYPNSLVLADTRVRKCETCGKWFSSIDDMRRHIFLTHTGTKPVACPLCGKRFGKSHQMLAHYKMHREARLEEFSILTKRRQQDVVSETSDASQTTVGSFHRVPKFMTSRISKPTDLNKSFGTQQSFQVSQDDKSEIKPEKISKPVNSDQLPDVRDSIRRSETVRKDQNSIYESVSLPKINKKQGIPTPDPGHISAIENVMGVSKAIETSPESHFIEEAENKFVRSRIEAISLAGRSPTPRSFKTRSGLTEYRKPKYLVDKEFWDTGSHVTERLTGYSPVSGYDPYSEYPLNSRGGRRKTSAFSFPSVR